jgi:hypothetical protein
VAAHTGIAGCGRLCRVPNISLQTGIENVLTGSSKRPSIGAFSGIP